MIWPVSCLRLLNITKEYFIFYFYFHLSYLIILRILNIEVYDTITNYLTNYLIIPIVIP